MNKHFETFPSPPPTAAHTQYPYSSAYQIVKAGTVKLAGGFFFFFFFFFFALGQELFGKQAERVKVKGKICVPGTDGLGSFSHKYYPFVLARAEIQLLS